jgi:hypothetical protein
MILVRFSISLRRPLAVINLAPSMYYYRRKRDDQPALELMRAYMPTRIQLMDRT